MYLSAQFRNRGWMDRHFSTSEVHSGSVYCSKVWVLSRAGCGESLIPSIPWPSLYAHIQIDTISFLNISTLKVLKGKGAHWHSSSFFKDKLMPRGTKHRKAIGNVAVITKCSTGETWPIRLYYANVRTLRFYGSAHYNLSTFLKELHAGFPFGRNGLHAELHYIRMQGVRCDLSLNLLWFVCFAKCQPTLIYPPGIWNYK